jgi:hypothetical protein
LAELLDYPFNMPHRLHALADPETLWLTRPVTTGRLEPADDVVIRRSQLHFRWRDNGTAPAPQTDVPRNLLEQFLAAETDERFLALAKRFGPLWLRSEAVEPQPVSPAIVRRDYHRGHRTEPLTAWRAFRARLLLILEVATMLREGDAMDIEALSRVAARFEGRPAPEPNTVPLLKSIARGTPALRRRVVGGMLGFRLGGYVNACAIHPTLEWNKTGTRADVVFVDSMSSSGNISFLGALIVQALSAAAGSAFCTCSSCGAAFVATRRPAANRRRYCNICRKAGMPLRDAKVAYRQRLKEAVQSGTVG